MALIDRIAKRLGYQKTEIRKDSLVQDLTFRNPVLAYEKPTGIADFIEVYRTHPWVNACIDKVAAAVASVPFKLYTKKDEDNVEVTDHYLHQLFDSVNNYTTVHDFWEQMVIDLEAAGNFFAEIEYAGSRPVALHHMRPDCVKIIPDPKKRVKEFEYTINGMTTILPAENVIHLYYYDPSSPLWGLSPLTSLALTLTEDYYARAFNRRFFENDATVPAVLETEKDLTKDDIALVRESWAAAHQGVDRAHKIALLWGGLKYRETGVGPKEAQFLELMKMNREEICAALGVPPAIVGIFEYANFANSEAQIKMFWQDKILPLLTKIEQMITEQFIQHFDPAIYGQFDTSGVQALQEDEARLTDIDVKLVSNGLALTNERRALRGLEPLPGGDVRYVPISWVPAGEEVQASKSARGNLLLKLKQKAINRIYKKFIPRLRKYFEKQAIRARELLERAVGENIAKTVNLLPPDEDDELVKLLSGLWVLSAEAAFDDLSQVATGLTFPNIEKVYPLLLSSIKGINDTTLKAINEVLQKGLEEGRSAYDIWHGAKDFKGISDVFAQASDYRAEMIARTETMRAYNTASVLTYRENGVQKVKIVDGQLPTSCDECISRNGDVVGIDEAMLIEDHPNGTLCLIPEEW
jgi:HK97 family phage portal protein